MRLIRNSAPKRSQSEAESSDSEKMLRNQKMLNDFARHAITI